MRRIGIVLCLIVLLQFFGCASPPTKTLVLRAEGQAYGHTVLKPDLSGMNTQAAATASVGAECHIAWQ